MIQKFIKVIISKTIIFSRHIFGIIAAMILVEIACRISPEAMIYSEIYHEWPQAIHGRFHREDPTFEI